MQIDFSSWYQTLSDKEKEEWSKNRSDEMKIRYSKGWESKAGRTKKIHYKSNIAGEVLLDGTWELKVAMFFDQNDIKWERNKKRFLYKDKDKERTYCPDFFLVDSNLYVEVKGYVTELDKIKWQQFTEKLEIWNKSVLKEKGILQGFWT